MNINHPNINRRHFLKTLGNAGIATLSSGLGGCIWLDEGFWNPCPAEELPDDLKNSDLMVACWQGLNQNQVWDNHVHLVGIGDSDSGIWVNPKMQSLLHLIQYTQFKFYLNGSCVEGDSVDEAYVQRLLHLHKGLKPDCRLMLLAFDYRHDENGQVDKKHTPLYVPNEYTASVAQAHPEVFEWVASIHPYREDCLEALDWAVSKGARAIKWLPGAMGIDPSSPRCDRFYDAVRKYGIPVLSHAGDEKAVDVADSHKLNNPLLLRRPLEQGVKIIVGHSASLGQGEDIEKNSKREVNYIDLFSRLMGDQRYDNILFGDISALTQVNRELAIIERVFKEQAWHPRLINGSDYPLPGVMPVYSIQRFVRAGWLNEEDAKVLSQIRRYNPLLFDFLLKRTLVIDGQRLGDVVFESARIFINEGLK